MRKAGWALGLVMALLLASGCGGSLEIDPRDLLTSEVSGVWESTAPVGTLGTLQLTLERRENSRVFDALLEGQTGGSLGDSDGFGTLADGHLIIDFGTGRTDEYYFEGNVVEDGATITGISGQFIFPGQAEALEVNFTYSGPLQGG